MFRVDIHTPQSYCSRNMGCDIHCYIELKREGQINWSSFGGRINPGRNYTIFANLAGVRSYNDREPVAPVRGYPSDAGYNAEDDYWLYVTEKEDDCESNCTRAQANSWVSQGVSVWKEGKSFVSNPDWHTHSWVTMEELSLAASEQNEPKYNAIISAMQSFIKDGFQSRVVFWFDN